MFINLARLIFGYVIILTKIVKITYIMLDFYLSFLDKKMTII